MDLTLLVREIQTKSKIYFTQIVIQSWQTEQQEPMYRKWTYLYMSIKKTEVIHHNLSILVNLEVKIRTGVENIINI